MKTMKKVFAGLTALCCISTLVSAFPATAEDDIETFIVIGVDDPENPNKYFLRDTGYTGYYVQSADMAEYADQEYFEVGDVLEFRNIHYYSNDESWTEPPTEHILFSESGGSIVKIDSIIGNPEIKEFTYVGYDYSTYFKDETDEYLVHFTSYYQPDKYDTTFLQEGDVVSFYTYEGIPYIPINTTPEDVKTDYLFMGSDQENYLLMDEAGQTYYLNKEALDAYLLDDEYHLQCGEVLRFRNVVISAPFSAVPATLPAELEEIPDKPSASAIADSPFYAGSIEKFDITASDEWGITLTNGDQSYYFLPDWITDTYQPDSFYYVLEHLLTRSEILSQQTVSCLIWNGMPFFPISEEYKDSLDYGYVVGLDDAENPQQVAIVKSGKSSDPSFGIFSMAELAPYLEDTQLKIGDVLQLRNLSFQYSGSHEIYLWDSGNAPEDRPKEITVTGSLYDNPTQEVILWAKNAQLTRVKTADGNQYNIYLLPDGIETAPAPDLTGLKQGAPLICIVDENHIPIMLYNPDDITPTGDADGNGSIDILDVIEVNRAVLGKSVISADRIPYIDFNGNGVADASDSLAILKLLVGLN